MLSSKSSSSSTLVTYVEEQSYSDQKTSVRFFCSSKSGCLSWLSAKASFQGRDVSVPYRSNLLKLLSSSELPFLSQQRRLLHLSCPFLWHLLKAHRSHSHERNPEEDTKEGDRISASVSHAIQLGRQNLNPRTNQSRLQSNLQITV